MVAVSKRSSNGSSTSSKRQQQHLIVGHERGRVTVLQLSTLLNQINNNSNSKLTLSLLSSVQIPFTLVSLEANPANEDHVSVVGLKDCHVLKFDHLGSVQDHIVLHPQLEGSNYIVKTVWLPGSQVE